MELSRAESAQLTLARPRLDPERGALVGSRCNACGTPTWPARAICAHCGSDDVEQTALPAVGSLASYTTVWVPRAGLPTPYVLGQVELGDGASVFAHVRGLADGATVPLDVRVVLAPAPDELPSFWFEPAESSTRGGTGD